VVSIGSAVAYAAMPSLIMANVPITETASANGLNALLRAVGTSTSSAVVAVVLSSVTAGYGGTQLPSPAAFQDVFWIAALASLAACAVVWFIPRPEPVPAEALAARLPAVTPAGESGETVVHGCVLTGEENPIPHAVTTVMKTSGEPVDWSRADAEGRFSLALPGPGEYLVVASAEGWVPRSRVVEFTGTDHEEHIHLRHRLSLTGWVLRDGESLPGALVALSAGSGEFVASTRTDRSGHYELPLPPAGRYVLTAVEAETFHTYSRKIIAAAESAVINLDLVGTALPRD
jgi:hypothetical protein